MERPFLIAFLFALTTASVPGDDFPSVAPEPVDPPLFEALMNESPFNRALNLSDSLILTGIARIDDEEVATLLNKETKETFVVSRSSNPQGWRMLELNTDEDLEKVSAKVSVTGGEIVTVRYADWQLKPGEAKPGAGPAASEDDDSSSKGKRRGPPSDIREKIGALSPEQRNRFFTRMREMHQKNPDMSQEDRVAAVRKMLEGISRK